MNTRVCTPLVFPPNPRRVSLGFAMKNCGWPHLCSKNDAKKYRIPLTKSHEASQIETFSRLVETNLSFLILAKLKPRSHCSIGNLSLVREQFLAAVTRRTLRERVPPPHARFKSNVFAGRVRPARMSLYAHTRRCLEIALRIHAVGQPAQTCADRRGLRARVREEEGRRRRIMGNYGAIARLRLRALAQRCTFGDRRTSLSGLADPTRASATPRR